MEVAGVAGMEVAGAAGMEVAGAAGREVVGAVGKADRIGSAVRKVAVRKAAVDNPTAADKAAANRTAAVLWGHRYRNAYRTQDRIPSSYPSDFRILYKTF